MKIAYDARMIYGNYSGVGQYSLNLLRALSRIDRQNQYLVLARNSFSSNLPDNFRIVNLDYYPLSFRTLYGLRRVLTKLGTQIFHSPFNLCPTNLPIPTIATIHDLMPLLLPKFFQGRHLLLKIYANHFIRFSLSQSLSKASCIVSVSNNTKNDIVNLGLAPAIKIRVCHNAPALSSAVLTSSSPEDKRKDEAKLRILTIGQTRPHKNWWKLIRAFRILKDKVKQGTLILVSSDDRNLKSIKTLISELKFKPEEISILGYQTQEELVRLYKSSDLFVFPSLYEGFGLPPLEAMACGVPVVASNRGSLPEVLGDAAYFVNPESEEDIAAGMQKVLEDSQLRDNLIQKGYQQVKKYSWEKTARQILDIYDEVYQETKK